MRSMHVWRTFAAAAIVVVAAATSAAGAAAGRDHPRQFHIEATFQSVLTTDAPVLFQSCDALLVKANGTARGTLLSGHATTYAEECTIPDYAGGHFYVHGLGTFTAPDGSMLSIEYHEDAPVPDFVTGTPFHDEGTFVVTGGTGRFAGATGSGTLIADGAIDPVTYVANVSASYDGVIQLADGQDRGGDHGGPQNGGGDRGGGDHGGGRSGGGDRGGGEHGH
jgi:uncharacterized membrane protein YgcG